MLPSRAAGDGGPSAEIERDELDNVPELGLSDDVFAGAEVTIEDDRGAGRGARARAAAEVAAEPEAEAAPEPEAEAAPEPEAEAEPEARG